MNLYSQFPALLFLIIFFIFSCDSQPTQVENNDDTGEPAFSHTLNPGTSGEDFLRGESFTEMVVEIQYMPGYKPTEAALDELKSFLENHTDKISVTILEPEQIAPGGKERYSANDIRKLEEEHRRHYTEDNILASYNLFVDGEYDQQNVLGIAYFNTSNALFGKTIHEVSDSPPLTPSRAKIEATVLRHEYGHLFGLVDNGTDMQEFHQGEGPHCSEEECLMYATVNTADFFMNLFDGAIPDFGDFCLADIQAAKNN